MRSQAGNDIAREGGSWGEDFVANNGLNRRNHHALRPITSARLSHIVEQSEATELPARRRIEEIAVGCTRMTGGRRLRASPQNYLVDHKLAIVFTERARRDPVARIRQIGAARPLPYDSEGIVQKVFASRDLPFRSVGKCLPAQRAKASAS